MLAKEYNEFIDLRRQPDTTEVALDGPSKHEQTGPNFYVNGVDLPVSDDDIDSTLTAAVKVKLRRLTINVENGKKRKSYDFELVGIKFND